MWRSRGGLEAADINAGAQRAAGTQDGLYLYQADERLAAGEVLYERVGEMVLQKAGQFGAVLTDAQEDFGNQVLNAFASDWCEEDATESDKWWQASDASAVSPQNLMFYDAPLYGYSEPLIYRGARIEEVTIYRWKKVAQYGAIAGAVHLNGKPLADADVHVSGQSTHSAHDGTFHFAQVPANTDLVVEAQKVQGGVLLSGQRKLTIAAHQTTNVVLAVKEPPVSYRRLMINGSQKTIDHEWAAAVDPTNFSEFTGFVDLDPTTATEAVRTFDCVADDDTLGRLILTFSLNSDNSVEMKTTMRVYDSNAPDTEDYDAASLPPFVIVAGSSGSWEIHVDGDNAASAWFTVSNETNPS